MYGIVHELRRVAPLVSQTRIPSGRSRSGIRCRSRPRGRSSGCGRSFVRVGRGDGAEGVRLWFLSAEALAIFKLLFFRTKDIADLERLLAVSPLDRAYVRRELVEMMSEDDVRVARWDELVRSFGGG